MKKLLALQISAFILVSGALGGLFFITDAYDEVKSRIVEVICLSCLKLNPKTSLDFTFKTANSQPHSDFVLEYLTNGPVFIAYRQDVCEACDIMEPIIQEIFSVMYEKEDAIYKGKEHSDCNIEYVWKLLSKLNLSHAGILQGIFPQETSHLIEDEKFIFVHIDVDVYKSVKEILEWAWDKVAENGIIVIDDYGFETCRGVTKFVNEFKKDKIFIYNLNGHGIFIKEKGALSNEHKLML